MKHPWSSRGLWQIVGRGLNLHVQNDRSSRTRVLCPVQTSDSEGLCLRGSEDDPLSRVRVAPSGGGKVPDVTDLFLHCGVRPVQPFVMTPRLINQQSSLNKSADWEEAAALERAAPATLRSSCQSVLIKGSVRTSVMLVLCVEVQRRSCCCPAFW